MLHVESNTFLSSLHCLVTFSTEHCYSNSATLASIMCDCHVWHFPKLCKATPKSCVTHALSTYVRLRLSHAWHLSQSCMALASAEVLHNLNHSLLFFFGSSFFFSLSSSFFHPPPTPTPLPICLPVVWLHLSLSFSVLLSDVKPFGTVTGSSFSLNYT